MAGNNVVGEIALNDSGWYYEATNRIFRSSGGDRIVSSSKLSGNDSRKSWSTISQIRPIYNRDGKQTRKGRGKGEWGSPEIDRVRPVNVEDVERLCAAFYEFPSAELAFLSDAKGEWDKAKPYSPQVLFKFSSPLSTSCAPSLCAPWRSWFREEKSCAKICRIVWPHDFVLSRRTECSKLFSENGIKVTELS